MNSHSRTQINTGGVLREEERVAQTAGRYLNGNSAAFASVLVALWNTADKWFKVRTIGLVLWPHAATNMPSLAGGLTYEDGNCGLIVGIRLVTL